MAVTFSLSDQALRIRAPTVFTTTMVLLQLKAMEMTMASCSVLLRIKRIIVPSEAALFVIACCGVMRYGNENSQ
jgi:hypothetical protein